MNDREPSSAGAGKRQAGRRRQRPVAGTRPSETTGGELERRAARLEFAEGALARLRVPVPAEGAEPGRNVLTDMDVLSVEVDLRLRISRGSLECKSSQGQSGEPQTLVWLAGFRQLLRLDRVVFVRPAVSSRGRALASRLGIAVLDEPAIAEREKSIAWLPDRFAHVDGPACTAAELRTDTQLKGLPDVPAALTQFLRHEALLADSPALLAAVESLRTAARAQGVLPEPTAAVLAGHGLIAVVLAGLLDARRLDEVSQRGLRDRLERALTTGDPDDAHLLPLLERADALVRHVLDRTHRAYTTAGADPVRIEMPSLREAVAAPPLYLDDYLDFVARLRANPLVARDLLQTCELACFDAALGDRAWRSEAFARLFTEEHRGLVLVALRCLESIAGSQVRTALEPVARLTFAAGRVPDRWQHAALPGTTAAHVAQPPTEQATVRGAETGSDADDDASGTGTDSRAGSRELADGTADLHSAGPANGGADR